MRTTLFVISLLLIRRPALAQPAGAQAEILFNKGIELLDAGKTSEACEAFDASQRLEPQVSTILNQANCRELNLQYATAWGLFLDAKRQTFTATDPRSRGFHTVAIERAAKLEARLSKLTVTIPDAAKVEGLAIRRAGHLLAIAEWNQPLPIDGGALTITASAPGFITWTGKIEVANELDVKSITVPRLVAAPKPPPPKRPIPSLVLGGSALALGVVALGFELSARGTYEDSKREPDDTKQIALWERANTKRYVGEAVGVAALVGAATSVWLYVRHRRREAPRLVLAPTRGPGSIGIHLQASF